MAWKILIVYLWLYFHEDKSSQRLLESLGNIPLINSYLSQLKDSIWRFNNKKHLKTSKLDNQVILKDREKASLSLHHKTLALYFLYSVFFFGLVFFLSVYLDPIHISYPSSKVSSLRSHSWLLQLRMFLIYSKSSTLWVIALWPQQYCLCSLFHGYVLCLPTRMSALDYWRRAHCYSANDE